jgi:hypothetical protein
MKINKMLLNIFILYFITSCNLITTSDRADYIGLYKFSLSKSSAINYLSDSGRLGLLTLEILENDSFYLSHDVPFFANQSGKVEYRSIDGIGWCYLIYHRNGVELHNQVGTDEFGELYINNTRAKTGAENISKAYFTRIR